MSVRKIRDLVTVSARRIQSQLSKLPAEAFNFFVKATPKDTGNARRKTKLVSNKTIEANYPYARRLDEGWSKQAPIGMSKPTDRYIRRRLQQIMRK
jgi:hypothetical protein